MRSLKVAAYWGTPKPGSWGASEKPNPGSEGATMWKLPRSGLPAAFADVHCYVDAGALIRSAPGLTGTSQVVADIQGATCES